MNTDRNRTFSGLAEASWARGTIGRKAKDGEAFREKRIPAARARTRWVTERIALRRRLRNQRDEMTGSNSAGQDEPCSSSSSETTQETKIHWERQTFYLLTRALMGDHLFILIRDRDELDGLPFEMVGQFV